MTSIIDAGTRFLRTNPQLRTEAERAAMETGLSVEALLRETIARMARAAPPRRPVPLRLV